MVFYNVEVSRCSPSKVKTNTSSLRAWNCCTSCRHVGELANCSRIGYVGPMSIKNHFKVIRVHVLYNRRERCCQRSCHMETTRRPMFCSEREEDKDNDYVSFRDTGKLETWLSVTGSQKSFYSRKRLVTVYPGRRPSTGLIITCWMLLLSNPGEYNDACDGELLAEVDHPDWSVDVEVVEHCASVERWAGNAVDCSTGETVLPARSNMPLHVTPITDPRLLVVRHVLHCINANNNASLFSLLPAWIRDHATHKRSTCLLSKGVIRLSVAIRCCIKTTKKIFYLAQNNNNPWHYSEH